MTREMFGQLVLMRIRKFRAPLSILFLFFACSEFLAPVLHGAITSFSGVAPSTTSIKWSWVDSSVETASYSIFSSTNGQIISGISAGTTSWVETNLTPNNQYSRFVKSFNAGGVELSSSTIATRSTLANPVTSISLTGATNSTLTIAWNSGLGGGAQFVIQRALDVFGTPGSYVFVATVPGNSSSYQDTGVNTGTTYWYRVIALDSSGNPASPSPNLTAVAKDGPIISHTPLTSIGVLGGDVTISAAVSDSTPTSIQSVRLFYRKKGESTFTMADFLPSPNLSLSYSGSVKILSSFVQGSLSTGGFEYMIVSSDSIRISSSPSSGVHSVTVAETLTFPPVGSNGGTIMVADGDPADGETTLTIPPGALSKDVQVTVKQLNSQTLSQLNGSPAVASYEFGPKGLVFDRSITIVLLYFDKNQDGFVDGTNIEEKNLKLLWYDGFSWRDIGESVVDSSANTVKANVFHFSTFGLFSGGGPTAESVRPKERIITPNGDKSNDFAQFGISGEFEISIYNIRGERIRRLENVNTWNGRKDDGEIAESGVYIYRVNSNQIKVSGTIGVAR